MGSASIPSSHRHRGQSPAALSGSHQAADELQQAEAARRARNLLARLRAAWRGGFAATR
jgi:hypothetical protein